VTRAKPVKPVDAEWEFSDADDDNLMSLVDQFNGDPFLFKRVVKSSQCQPTVKRHSIQVLANRYQQLVAYSKDVSAVTVDPPHVHQIGDEVHAVWMCNDNWLGDFSPGVIIDVTKASLVSDNERYGVLFAASDNTVFSDDPKVSEKFLKEYGEECQHLGKGIEPFFVIPMEEVMTKWKFSSGNKISDTKMKGVEQSKVVLGGWETTLTGRHVFRSLLRALHTVDTLYIIKCTAESRSVTKRELNMQEAWDFPRGSTLTNPPVRISGFEHVANEFVEGSGAGSGGGGTNTLTASTATTTTANGGGSTDAEQYFRAFNSIPANLELDVTASPITLINKITKQVFMTLEDYLNNDGDEVVGEVEKQGGTSPKKRL
jgi:hypothetical protein